MLSVGRGGQINTVKYDLFCVCIIHIIRTTHFHNTWIIDMGGIIIIHYNSKFSPGKAVGRGGHVNPVTTILALSPIPHFIYTIFIQYFRRVYVATRSKLAGKAARHNPGRDMKRYNWRGWIYLYTKLITPRSIRLPSRANASFIYTWGYSSSSWNGYGTSRIEFNPWIIDCRWPALGWVAELTDYRFHSNQALERIAAKQSGKLIALTRGN